MNSLRVFALTGIKRSGKDVTGSYLSSILGNARVFQIAGPLKDGVSVMFGIPREDLEGDIKDFPHPKLRSNISPRYVLQKIGTDFAFPILGKTVWVDQCIDKIRNTPESNIIITDLRFLHEYNALLKEFGSQLFVIKIVRTRYSQLIDYHVSEQEIEKIPYNYLIENNGSLGDLCRKISYSTLYF
jgi:hypothetical protein